MKKVSFLLALNLLLSGLYAQTFFVNDVLVSDYFAQIGDPEFDPINKRICWQSVDDHKLWVCDLDTLTWKLSVPDGKQTLLDASLVPLAQTLNAGEWAFSQQGSYVVYTKLIASTPYIAVAIDNGNGWVLNTLTDEGNRFNPRATKNPLDVEAAVQYVTYPGTGTTKYKFFSGPATEFSVADFKDAHWADDEQILTGILPNNQVGLYDPISPASPAQLTFSSGTTYSRPYMWRAPEFGQARMFFAKANGNEIHVFKESAPGSNTYHPFLQFTSPSARPNYENIGSPEPLVYDGKSYLTFMASSSPLETSGVPAEIWIVAVDSLNPVFRMVSDSVERVRTDPEPFPTDSTLFIYYSEVNDSLDANSYGTIDPSTILRLRRCDSGFNHTGTTDMEQISPSSAQVFLYPNPFTHSLALKNAAGQEHFVLLNALGQTCYQGKDLVQQDFSNLESGIYLLKISDPASGETHFQKLIKQ